MLTHTDLKEPDKSALEVAYYSSDIWVGTYLETLPNQHLTAQGAANIAPWTAKICASEGAEAHRPSAEACTNGYEPTDDDDGSPGGSG
jgi:histidinol dehydrogenase